MLKSELSGIPLQADGMPALSDVEGLPYLGAIIQEAVRLHPGVMSRQMRVSPDVPIEYYSKSDDRLYVVPPGTVYSASPLDTHMDPSAFENPYDFRPSRWIEDPKLARYFHGFARGSRNCVGYVLHHNAFPILPRCLNLPHSLPCIIPVASMDN